MSERDLELIWGIGLLPLVIGIFLSGLWKRKWDDTGATDEPHGALDQAW